MNDRSYDLVLLGATGFTGGLVAEHLARRLADTDTSWAIAGRNQAKLTALAERLPGEVGTEVVDVGDLVGLLELAERTRVIATTVGPFARHGELVAQACVRAGTHYADITGEPAFVDLLRARYDADARRRGVALVSCCGFDSVPHDLGVRDTVALLPDDAPLTVRAYVRSDARLSGGTALSGLEAIASRALPRPEKRRDGGREVSSLPVRVHRVDELDAWGVPLPTIDPVIVLRSARELDGYGSSFRYGHFARVARLPSVIGGVAGVGVLAGLASFGPTRSLLSRMLPDPGSGPSAERRARSFFEVTFLGEGGGQRAATRVSGGDPGYDETAKMLGEAALTLAQHGAQASGAVTPAIGLGAPYRARLSDQGLRFEALEAG